MTVPRFTHDCSLCSFLGQDAEHDLYFCEGCFRSDIVLPSVLARFGNDGPEYISGLDVARQVRSALDFEHPLARALTLAEEQGHLKRPEWVVSLPDDPNGIRLNFDAMMLDKKMVPGQVDKKRLAAFIKQKLMEEFFATKITPTMKVEIASSLHGWLKEFVQV